MLKFVNSLRQNERGATAVEFALYSTAFLSMLFGGIYASMVGFTSSSLYTAVQSAARCRAMAVTCTNAATAEAHALARFRNLSGGTPTFTSLTATCGNRVTGTLSLPIYWVRSSKTIRLSAAACFPTQAASTT
jgi:Flp pilus assembly protein TadG